MNRALAFIVPAMLFQQAMSYGATLVVPLMAVAVARDLAVSPNLVGYYTSAAFLASALGQLMCGGFIRSEGAVRVSQASLVLIGAGLASGAAGVLPALLLSALLIGLGNAVSTPASSHLLARYSPPRNAPLIFSLKQTGVPVGGALAGLAIPLLLGTVGWQLTFVAVAAVSVAFALFLQPRRAGFDADRLPDFRPGPGDVGQTLSDVFGHPGLRALAIAMFCFVGMQSLFGSYFIVIVEDRLGFDNAVAGELFAIAMTAAIPARILWGWIGGGGRAPVVLAALGLAMAGAAVLIGLFDSDHSRLRIGIVATLYTATAIGWHGLLLAEVARLAPAGRIGATTGGVLACGGAGMTAYPMIYATILEIGDDHGIGFHLLAVPAVLAGLNLVRVGRR